MVKDKDALLQLGLVTIIVVVVGGLSMMGMSWMAEEFGSGGAMMFAVLVFFVVKDDKEVRGERHQLPSDEEEERVVGQGDQHHAP